MKLGSGSTINEYEPNGKDTLLGGKNMIVTPYTWERGRRVRNIVIGIIFAFGLYWTVIRALAEIASQR